VTRYDRHISGLFVKNSVRSLEGARGIEPPPGLLDRANGFAARGAPIAIAPVIVWIWSVSWAERDPRTTIRKNGTVKAGVFRPSSEPTNHG
jgi:hypothetical protein